MNYRVNRKEKLCDDAKNETAAGSKYADSATSIINDENIAGSAGAFDSQHFVYPEPS